MRLLRDCSVVAVMTTSVKSDVEKEFVSVDDRLSALAETVAGLAHRLGSDAIFLQEVVGAVHVGMAARGVAVWSLNSQSVLSLATEKGLAELGITRDPQRSKNNIRLLLDCVQSQQSLCVHDSGHPIDLHVPLDEPAALFVPLICRERCFGAIQVFLSVGVMEGTPYEIQNSLEELAATIAWSLEWRETSASTGDEIRFWQEFDATLAAMNQSLDSERIATECVNRGTRLLGCDRLSVVVAQGPRAVTTAVTGQDRIHNRAIQTRQLTDLGRAVIRSGRVLDSFSNASGWPEEIKTLLLEHQRNSGARGVRIVPLRRAAEINVNADLAPPKSNDAGNAVAALVIEQFSTAWFSPIATKRIDQFANHLGNLLANAFQHERAFLRRTRHALGHLIAPLDGRRRLKVILASILTALVVFGMTQIPATYRVVASGKLMPVTQRDLFAPREAEVVAVEVQGGDWVKAGTPLLILRDASLDAEVLSARNRLTEKQQQLSALQAEITEATRRGSRPDEVVRMRGRVKQSQAEINAAQERLDALETERDRLTLRAPIDGTVANFQVEQQLLHRPVHRGEVLLTVMDEAGPWQLELSIPEHRMGHVIRSSRDAERKRLPVEFVLATSPELSYEGELNTLATRTEARTELGTIVSATVDVDQAEIESRRIGAEATARIACGKRSLAYIVFGDLIELIQKTFW